MLPHSGLLPLIPANPLIATSQVKGRRLIHQTPSVTARVIAHKGPNMFPKRLAIPKIMGPINKSVPQLTRVCISHTLQPQRAQFRQGDSNLGLWIRLGCPYRLLLHVFSDHRRALRRQCDNPLTRQRLQHAQTRGNLVIALPGCPMQMLANHFRQFMTALVGQMVNGFLNFLSLLAGQSAPGKCRCLDVNDPLVHDRSPLFLTSSSS